MKVWSRRDAYPVDAVYVGRPSAWGNPFKLEGEDKRWDVVLSYAKWLAGRPELVARMRRELAGKDLVCWCAPRPCHGHVILEVANGMEVGEVVKRVRKARDAAVMSAQESEPERLACGCLPRKDAVCDECGSVGIMHHGQSGDECVLSLCAPCALKMGWSDDSLVNP